MVYKIEWCYLPNIEAANVVSMRIDPRKCGSIDRPVRYLDFGTKHIQDYLIAAKITGDVTEEELKTLLQLAKIRYGLD